MLESKSAIIAAIGVCVGVVATLVVQAMKPDSFDASRPQNGLLTPTSLSSSHNGLQSEAITDGTESADELSSLLRKSVTGPKSDGGESYRLLRRLAAADPAFALREFEALGLGSGFGDMIYAEWARNDLPAVLRELANAASTTEARRIATAILREYGTDPDIRATIEASLPQEHDIPVGDLALEVLAQNDISAAVELATSLEDVQQRETALRRLLPQIVRLDPAAALAAATSLTSGPVRRRFESNLLDEWATADPVGLTQWIASGMLPPLNYRTWTRSSALTRLAEHDPATLYASAAMLDSDMQSHVRSAALQAWGRQDIDAATDIALSTVGQSRRKAALWAVARGYAATEPEAALAWATEQAPGDDELLVSVIEGIATTDPLMAFDTLSASSLSEGMFGRNVRNSIVRSASLQDNLNVLAEYLLTRPSDPQRDRMLTQATEWWARSDPQTAFDWLRTRPNAASQSTYQAMGASFAMQNPHAAAGLVNQIPEEFRGVWIQQVAAAMADEDAAAAVAWLDQHAGSPNYAGAISTVANVVAQRDPQAALTMINRVEHSDVANDIRRQAVDTWSMSEPQQAAAWAATLEDTTRRGEMLAVVMSRWASKDFAASKSWLLAQPAGEARDGGLSQMVRASTHQTLDADIMNAFNDEHLRQQAVANLALSLTNANDLNRARAIVDEHITDAEMKQRVTGWIERRSVSRSTYWVRP